jgi:2-hydroxychromene-2-carboxylate isomerase
MAQPALDFSLEYASTYSYVAERIGALARDAGVRVRWRPFLLGPIFQAEGWNTSPFNIYPGKGRYMWRDMERICQTMGLPLKRPEQFPQNSILAARGADRLCRRLGRTVLARRLSR